MGLSDAATAERFALLQYPSLPPGQIVYAIGDIHGRADLLAKLLAAIESDAAKTAGDVSKALIFVGDYIDRGPHSRQVVDLLLQRLPPDFEAHFLKGNHEAILLDFLTNPRLLDLWRANGADATFASYGMDVARLVGTGADEQTWHGAFLAALPEEHLRFFERLELSVSYGDFFFVHAGVRPGIPLTEQDPHDLVWIRDEFLDSEAEFGKVVVHGHTPDPYPDFRWNRIGIDTGAVFTDQLTALRLDKGSPRLIQCEV